MKHPMNNQNIVKSRIRQEWENFTNHFLLYDKETIRNMCDKMNADAFINKLLCNLGCAKAVHKNYGKIHFYDCVMIYFSENDRILEKVFRFLWHREEIILNMWLLYLKQEHLRFLTWRR